MFGAFPFGAFPFGASYSSSLNANVSLVGVTGTAGVGSFKPNPTPKATGVTATTAVGAFSVQPSSNIYLTGVAATGAVGAFSVQSSSNIYLTGVAATGDVAVIVPDIQQALSGVHGTASVSGFGIEIDTNISLVGVYGAGHVGSFGLDISSNIHLSGVYATGVVAGITDRIDSHIDLSSVLATADVGQIFSRITKPLPAFPSLTANPSQLTWGITGLSQTFTSEALQATYAVSVGAEAWHCSLTFDTLTEQDWRLMSAFLASQDGGAGRFYFGPLQQSIAGAGGGNPIVSGGSQTGASINTSGWPATTLVLKAGDYFSFTGTDGSELKQVSSDVTSDGSGNAVITFSPNIRISPSNGAQIVLTNPVCVMRMADPTQGGPSITPPLFGSFTLDLTEVILL